MSGDQQLRDVRQMVIERNRAARLEALAEVERRAQTFNARREAARDQDGGQE